MPDCYTIVVTGLGGQGLIKFIQTLGTALTKADYKVISSETHGLSQRGGRVTSFLRFGNKIQAPIPMIGTADIIIALEESTILDTLKYAKPNKSTHLIVSTYEKLIIGVEYPSIQSLMDCLYEKSFNISLIPAMTIAKNLTNSPKTMNSVILGYILKLIPLSKNNLEESIKQNFTGSILESNIKAFNEGMRL